MEPADFYTGIVAELYEPLKSTHQGPGPYTAFIEGSGEPALELGCGDGDPLLHMRWRGLDVEGVDSSADMLARCRHKATKEGLDVVLHHQRMEALDPSVDIALAHTGRISRPGNSSGADHDRHPRPRRAIGVR